MSTDALASATGELIAAVAGPVWVGDGAERRAELSGFNVLAAHRPEIVVGATGTADVAAAVRWAAAHGTTVAVQATGHGASTAIETGVVITTARLARLDIDPVARRATVGAGVRWADLLEAAAPYGLTAVSGSAPSVGVVGLVLGGGIGPLGRTLGFASDRIVSIRIVTSDGAVRDVDRISDPELFWALRGGKRGFGVVVSVTLELVELRELIGGCLWFGAADAESVMRGWARLSAGLPDSVTSSVAILRLPSLLELPEPLRGRLVVQVRFAAIGDDGGALAVLRALAEPLIDTVGPLPAYAIGAIHGDPSEPMPVWDTGELLTAFDEQAADALLATAGPGCAVPLMVVEIRRCGAALSRAPEGGDAVGGRDAAYSVFVAGAPVPDLIESVVPQAAGEVLAALRPWSLGRTQVNFHGAITEANPESRSWDAETYARIQKVRRRCDPDGVFAR